MRVLFVCHRVPYPPKRGGKIRPFNIIRHLAGRGHEVTVASLARSESEREEAAALEDHCAHTLIEVVANGLAWGRMLARVPTATPSSFGYFDSPPLRRKIEAELAARPYDLVFVHCSSVAPYVRHAKVPTKILDFGDMDSQKWREYAAHRAFPQSLVYAVEAAKLERMERTLSQDFDLCTCTTRAELESLQRLGATGLTDWFPNGVDTEYFAPAAESYDVNLVTFVGRMDYYPNQQAVQEFCAHVLPALRARRPQVRFEIVGADPPDSIRALARLEGVTVTGSVPDVRPYVTRAAATVAPLLIARGTQNKILESMAMGVPVVCSPAASGGVDAVPGQHLLVAENAKGYVDALAGLMDSVEARRALAQAARARVLQNHSWKGSMERLDEIVAATLVRQAAHARTRV